MLSEVTIHLTKYKKYFYPTKEKTETNNICKKRNLRHATLSLRKLLFTEEAKKNFASQ